MSTLFLLTIAVALLLVAAAVVHAVIVYRRETRRAQFGRGQDRFENLHHRRRLVM